MNTVTTVGLRCLSGCLIAAAGMSCARNSLYFGTKNTIGAEVSGTTTLPSQVSVSYQRSEVALIPSKADGTAHSVYGYMDYDFSWFDGLALAQVFATGEAATAAASGEKFTTEIAGGTFAVKRARGSEVISGGDNQGGRLFFATNTKVGLSLDLGQSLGQTVPGFLFGYRRDEATIVPIGSAQKEVNSVFADLSIVVDRGGKVRRQGEAAQPRAPIASDRLPGSPDGIRIKQRFATGRAALLVATTDENREKLAGQPVTPARALEAIADNSGFRDRAKRIVDPARQAEFLAALARVRPDAANWTWSFFLGSGFTFLTPADRDALRSLLPSP